MSAIVIKTLPVLIVSPTELLTVRTVPEMGVYSWCLPGCLGGLQVKLGLVERIQPAPGGIGRYGPAGQGGQINSPLPWSVPGQRRVGLGGCNCEWAGFGYHGIIVGQGSVVSLLGIVQALI